jgi:Rrf2 family protein
MSLQLSTRSRYGLRLMIALSMKYGQGITLMRDVSRNEDISEKYLGQIIIPLKAAGLVTSQRGSHGGYSLARDPKTITVRDVVEAIEGDIVPVPCTDESSEPCERLTMCAAAKVWKRLADQMRTCLAATTLADLVKDSHQCREQVENYAI